MQPNHASAVVAPSPAGVRVQALDLAHAGAVRDELLARVTAGSTTFDLAAVETCDLAGLQLLWAARASAQTHGHRFHIVSPSAAVQAAAAAFGLDLAALQETP